MLTLPKILVVEDEAITSMVITEQLSQLGYIVTDVVNSGTRAIASVVKNPPHLVLMDIIIKGDTDGIITASRIWKEFKIPVVYLTAHSDKATLDRAKVTAAFGYVVKPFGEQDLQIAIEMALNKHRMERNTEELLTSEIGARMDTEAQLKVSIQQKEVLLQEVHHRIKNNFQMLASFLNLQSNYIDDEVARKTLKISQSHIRAMALIHEKLYRSKGLAKVEFAEYIQELVTHLSSVYGDNSKKVAINLNIDKLSLVLDTAIPCGLIVNELVLNAVKHAFPESESGNIHIDMHQRNGSNYELNVSDNGIGVPPEFNLAKTKSLGLLLVNALTKQLRGTIELNRKDGTQFKILFPASVHK